MWGDTPVCPTCGATRKVYKLHGKKRKHHYKCNVCPRIFNVKTGTVLQGTRRPLRDWVFTIYAMVTSRKGISALQLSKELGVSYNTAWFMLHRARYACVLPLEKLKGIVEVDETNMGPRTRNLHASQRRPGGQGGQFMEQLVGFVERGTGKTIIVHLKNRNDAEALRQLVRDHVEPGTILNTDGLPAYEPLAADRYHIVRVIHSKGQYSVDGNTTNSIESTWATVKRTTKGTHHHVDPKYMQYYANEWSFRRNWGNCEIDTIDRMKALFNNMQGLRLTHYDLTGRVRKEPEKPAKRRGALEYKGHAFRGILEGDARLYTKRRDQSAKERKFLNDD